MSAGKGGNSNAGLQLFVDGIVIVSAMGMAPGWAEDTGEDCFTLSLPRSLMLHSLIVAVMFVGTIIGPVFLAMRTHLGKD
jgi:hypothetical protein